MPCSLAMWNYQRVYPSYILINPIESPLNPIKSHYINQLGIWSWHWVSWDPNGRNPPHHWSSEKKHFSFSVKSCAKWTWFSPSLLTITYPQRPILDPQAASQLQRCFSFCDSCWSLGDALSKFNIAMEIYGTWFIYRCLYIYIYAYI